MTHRARIALLAVFMTLVAFTASGVAIFSLYRAALEQERAHLIDTARSAVRLIEAVARFDKLYSAGDVPGGAFAATLSQIEEAYERFEGFGATGEFTLARRDGDQIVFLLSHRHLDLTNPRPVPLDSELAEPMRRALSGQSGADVALDYRGEKVLAAYEPVAELTLGFVAKIDLTEIRAPFIRAGLLACAITFLVTALATGAFFWFSEPLIRHIRDTEREREELALEIAARKRVEDVLHREHSLLDAIRQAQSQFILGVDPHTLFEGLLDALISLTQSEYAFIGEVLRNPDGDLYLKTRAITNITWNEETRRLYEKQAAQGLEFTNLETLFGAVMTTGRPQVRW